MNAPILFNAEDAVALGAESLSLFGALFFPRTFRQDTPPFHDDIGARLYSASRFNAFEIFRGGAKTSLLRVFTAQRIAYAISHTIQYISVSQGHAMFSVRWVRRQIEHNKKFASAFGLRPGKKWTDEWCEIVHEVNGEIITMLALGITGQVRGFNPDDFRPDLIVLDDVIADENSATPEQRAKLSSLIHGAVVPSLAPTSEAPLAKLVFINTPMHRDDEIEKALLDPKWNGVRYGCYDEAGNSRWPTRFPLDVLLQEEESARATGRYRIWAREMKCELVSGEDKAIDVTKLEFWTTLPEGMTRVISIDPASSDSKGADDNVIMTVGFSGLDVYVIAFHADKGVMPDAASTHFFEQVMTFTPIQRAVVEKVAYQRTLKWYIEQEMAKRRVFVPMDGIDDRRRKADRIMQAIPGLVAYGHLYVHASMKKLIEQMDDYDPKIVEQADDLLDALAMAITAINPALRNTTIDGEFSVVDESAYEDLNFGGCP
jgi:hypothetical protein